MATAELSELMGALQTAAVHAQVKAHAVLREYVKAYASDVILRTFKIPGMEVESIEFNVPVKTGSLQTSAPTTTSVLTLATNVIARRGRIKAANLAKVQAVFTEQLRKTESEAKSLAASLSTADRLIAVTSDVEFAKRLRTQLREAEVTVDLESLEIPLQVGTLNVDTEPASGEPTTTVFIKIRPQSYRLVQDGTADGEEYILQAVD